MNARARLSVPIPPRAGEDFEVRLLLEHPMETGLRVDADGRRLPRDIVQEVEALVDGRRVWRARLHPAVAANPYLSFWLRLDRSARLDIVWRGDGGFEHRHHADLTL